MKSLFKKPLAGILVLALGLGLMLYPYVSNLINQHGAGKVVFEQAETIQETDQAELARELARARDYNSRLLDNRVVVTDPFDPTAQKFPTEEYNGLLNIAGDGVMGQLVIPKLKVSLPIYHGTDDEVLQKCVGHIETTSLPAGGESTHSVLAGHNGLPTMQIFDRIEELQPGDYFVIKVLGEDLAYKVTGSETVLPDETGSLVITRGQDEITLVTCVPYGVNTHRLLVHAKRCDLPDSWEAGDQDIAEETNPGFHFPWIEALVIAGAIAAGIIIARAFTPKRGKHSIM